MRALSLLLVVGLLATPFAAAASVGCWLLPPGAFPGAGGCTRTFTSGAGTIVISVETLFGSVGEVVVHGTKSNGASFAATCTLAYSSGSCTAPIAVALTPGTYSLTAAATNANLASSDSRVWLSVSYPDFS